MRTVAAAVIVGALVTACQAPAVEANQTRAAAGSKLTRPMSRVVDGELGGLQLVSDQTEPINGERPRLVVTCSDDSAPFVAFFLVERPVVPPPLRGVFGFISPNGMRGRPVEMAWAGDTSWMPRDRVGQRDGAAQAEWAQVIAAATSVRLFGLEDHGVPERTWTIDLPDEERGRFGALCRQSARRIDHRPIVR
jgi:hypothetical protein